MYEAYATHKVCGLDILIFYKTLFAFGLGRFLRGWYATQHNTAQPRTDLSLPAQDTDRLYDLTVHPPPPRARARSPPLLGDGFAVSCYLIGRWFVLWS